MISLSLVAPQKNKNKYSILTVWRRLKYDPSKKSTTLIPAQKFLKFAIQFGLIFNFCFCVSKQCHTVRYEQVYFQHFIQATIIFMTIVISCAVLSDPNCLIADYLGLVELGFHSKNLLTWYLYCLSQSYHLSSLYPISFHFEA